MEMMWWILLVAITAVSFSETEAMSPLLDDFYDSNTFLSRPMKSFWHLNNRGRVMEKVFSELHLQRPQRALAPVTPAPSRAARKPCICHYVYFTTHYCSGDCARY